MTMSHSVALLTILLCLLPASNAWAEGASANPDPVRVLAAADTTTPGFAGTWQGELTVPTGSLRVVFNLARSDSGDLTGTLDSPDQGAQGIPIGEVLVDADTLRVSIPSISGAFAGVADDDRQAINGTWYQGGTRLPLNLKRVEQAPALARPQEPTRPYPYETEDVTFRNEKAGITLAGTLSLPEGMDTAPAVVLVSGSGAQDRDGTVLGHKTLLVLADYLTRRGVAVLRFDERGVGASEGNYASATTADLAGDVLAAVRYVAQHPAVDMDDVGIIGHSEGGLIAPMVANATKLVDFIVLLATPGLPGEQVLLQQQSDINEASGVDSATIAVQRGTQQRIFDVVKQPEADSMQIAQELRAVMLDIEGIEGEAVMQREIQRLTSPWFRYFLSYDPRFALMELQEPVLAVTGSKDLQVDSDSNLKAIERALNEGGNDDVTIQEVEGLNHLLQTAQTGSPGEYGRIEETIAPRVLDLVGDWIAAHTKLPDPSE